MEIERKWLIPSPPADLKSFPHRKIEQAYLCTDPVVRVRQKGNDYILTIKGRGMLAREEHELPLTAEAYGHLLAKADGRIITKTRYNIPLICEGKELLIELDHFERPHRGLYLAEIEFSSVEEALAFTAPDWFGEDVTDDPAYHNSYMSQLPPEEA